MSVTVEDVLAEAGAGAGVLVGLEGGNLCGGEDAALAGGYPQS